MIGKIVVVVLVASGPGSLAFSESEITTIDSEVAAALDFWTSNAPASAGLSFSLYLDVAYITASDSASCSEIIYSLCHDVFVNPTLQHFGFSTGQAGIDQLAQAMRNSENANGAFIAFFSKYKQSRSAYAEGGSGPIYMQYSNGAWGNDLIDRVFAHETGHVFNAPDEYKDCVCGTDYGEGTCTAKNNNCLLCTSSQSDCIMNENVLNICSATRKHVGWC